MSCASNTPSDDKNRIGILNMARSLSDDDAPSPRAPVDMQYESVTATDAANFMEAIAVMVVVALVARTLPALRATRIDPLAVIRDE
jgi:hypothetical protein